MIHKIKEVFQVRKVHILIMFLLTSMFLFSFACIHNMKREKGSFNNGKKMTHGKIVDAYWVDKNVSLASYSSIQIPDFKEECELNGLEWIKATLSDLIADSLRKKDVISLIDRTPQLGVSWTDLVMKGKITSFEKNTDTRSFIKVEIKIEDTRLNKTIAYINHSKTTYSNAIGTKNPIHIMLEDITKDIVTFLKQKKETQLKKK